MGCSKTEATSNDTRAAKPTAIPTPATNPTSPRPRGASYSIEWRHVIAPEECFFFSGPEGRDDRLTGTARFEREGTTLILHIGAAEFRGRVTEGTFELARHSAHQFGGPWTVDETITSNQTIEAPIEARYHYTECEQDGECPGHCTIDATIIFRRR